MIKAKKFKKAVIKDVGKDHRPFSFKEVF
jgi:hypothetical protein